MTEREMKKMISEEDKRLLSAAASADNTLQAERHKVNVWRTISAVGMSVAIVVIVVLSAVLGVTTRENQNYYGKEEENISSYTMIEGQYSIFSAVSPYAPNAAAFGAASYSLNVDTANQKIASYSTVIDNYDSLQSAVITFVTEDYVSSYVPEIFAGITFDSTTDVGDNAIDYSVLTSGSVIQFFARTTANDMTGYIYAVVTDSNLSINDVINKIFIF